MSIKVPFSHAYRSQIRLSANAKMAQEIFPYLSKFHVQDSKAYDCVEVR